LLRKRTFEPRLPDGIFSDQTFQLGLILECLAMEDDGKFYGRMVCVIAISYTLWPFGIFCSPFGTFFPYWYVIPEKSGNPVLNTDGR
jgi:hypothetical protein